MRQQEPGGSGEEILAGIRYVRPGNDYVPNFRLVQKLDVNGETQHPLFEFLKSRCPSPVSKFRSKDNLFYSPQDSADIRWNFEKFLVGRDGTPLRRYEPQLPAARHGGRHRSTDERRGSATGRGKHDNRLMAT
ncbi:hypothetical protein MRX96_011109 [Rhipicephalus microplus]